MIFGIIALAVTAFSAVQQYREARKQAKIQEDIAREQKKQQELQKRVADVKAARERAEIARNQRIRRATMVAGAEATGGAGGSALAGGAGSLLTRSASEVGFNLMGQAAGDKIFASNQRIGDLSIDASQSMSHSAMWGAVGKIAGGVFSATGGFGQFAQGGSSAIPSMSGQQGVNFMSQQDRMLWSQNRGF